MSGVNIFKAVLNRIKPMSGIGGPLRLFARKFGENIGRPIFPKAVDNSNKLALIAGSAALTLTGYYLQDDAEEKVDEFMQSYGNNIFLECMANDSFRESINELRNAELLYYGISFEENEQKSVFYRGMSLPNHLDQKDPEQIKQWQKGIIQSFYGRGFSPLLWLTRPSATRTSGFNIHPHDGSVARALDTETAPPPSWSAAVMAMTCNFNIAKSYSTLESQGELNIGCIILAAPKRTRYLSSTDVKSRHELNLGHEFEVITPSIESSDTLAILFVENGKISRVEINIENLNHDVYSIDPKLVQNLNRALSNASPDAQSNLSYLIDRLDGQNNKIDLEKEFDIRFNLTAEELVKTTEKFIRECDDEIDKVPGILGRELRYYRQENKVRPIAEVAEKLGLFLSSESSSDSPGPSDTGMQLK